MMNGAWEGGCEKEGAMMVEWKQDLQVVAIVVAQGEEFMSMVSGRWLVEVKQRYLYLQK
jgi:hypothetical protein